MEFKNDRCSSCNTPCYIKCGVCYDVLTFRNEDHRCSEKDEGFFDWLVGWLFWVYSTDIVFLCRFSVWGVFPRRFRLVWQTVFLRFRLHRFVPFSIRKSVCVTDQSKAVTRRFLSLQKTSFTHAQILQTKTAFAETLFRQEPIRFT